MNPSLMLLNSNCRFSPALSRREVAVRNGTFMNPRAGKAAVTPRVRTGGARSFQTRITTEASGMASHCLSDKIRR